MSRAKLGRQLDQWRSNERLYSRRGWVLLDVSDLTVTVGFLVDLPAGVRTWPVMTVCVRVQYDNFDLWPPSVTFVDPFTREPTVPLVQAPDELAGEIRDVLVAGHPLTGLPFLCLPGIREYHIHPQHTGDDWLLHRADGAGNLIVVCERVWRRMAHNVLGVGVQAVNLRQPATPQVQLNLLQGDADAFAAQILAAQAAAAGQTPPGGQTLPADQGPPSGSPAGPPASNLPDATDTADSTHAGHQVVGAAPAPQPPPAVTSVPVPDPLP